MRSKIGNPYYNGQVDLRFTDLTYSNSKPNKFI